MNHSKGREVEERRVSEGEGEERRVSEGESGGGE